LGHVGDTHDMRHMLSAGIEAFVDLAANEPLLTTAPRDLVYCRYPLVDGSGNSPWLLKAAIRTVADLLENGVPTLVFCSAGMSRSPAIAAAAIAVHRGCSLEASLIDVEGASGGDVSPSLLADVQLALEELQRRR
jgi:protein-tyrosine phosphatase